jgi:ornithine carbamoyltransferase
VADVARVLSRMCDGIMARVFEHQTVQELARWSIVPVINGLSDSEHPCQAMADLLTLKECKGLENRKIAYLGDGNNVCHSLMILCAKLGVHFSVAAPEGYEPQNHFVALAQEEAKRSSAQIEIVRDPKLAVQNADALYTDVWTSMGQEEEARQRAEVFPPYQLNAELLRHAKPEAIVLHDLPAHKGEEISEEVFEAHADMIFSQAENRLHAQKAIVAWLLG